MKYLPWAVLLIALILGYGWHQKRIGVLEGQIASLEVTKARVDTVYTRDTLTLTKFRRVTDSVLITDTVIRVDSVKVLIAVEREACDRIRTTCEQRVAVRDSLIKALKKKQGSGWLGCAAGATVNTKGFGPGATCGFRF
jgi:hypothetical protein